VANDSQLLSALELERRVDEMVASLRVEVRYSQG
jgi:hypothetical protein